ncbi:Prenylated rab acceptor PRA1 [Artemisia annua]|uniref:Prenylated rab acceptor PRA1 n=1 Tax=Artemisia annua TaxID=35608 RepID=A0A2U1NXS7_ARTAN|nr:Prenylated rab acceptor PRA1 [Artemisia annua]
MAPLLRLLLVLFVLWLFFLLYARCHYVNVTVFGRVVDDRVMFVGLSIVTVVLCFTSVGVNVFVALVVVVVWCLCPDDLFLDESEAVEGGLLSVVGSGSGEALGRGSYGLN